MSFLRHMTIKQKLTAIIMSTAVVALLGAMGAFLTWEFFETRKETLAALSTEANIIADNAKAALAFGDKQDAEKVLSSLAFQKNVVFACIYDDKGRIFATYTTNGNGPDNIPGFNGQTHAGLDNGYLFAVRPILLDGHRIGTIYLRADLSKLYRNFIKALIVCFVVVVVILFVAYFQASWLQKIISAPLGKLTAAAGKLGAGDLDARADVDHGDELGQLARTFNDMAEKLRFSHAQLEEKVRRRTAELSRTNDRLQAEITRHYHTQAKLQQRVKHLHCFYSLSRLIEQPEVSLEHILQEASRFIQDAYPQPRWTCVRITYDGITYQTENFSKTELSQHADIRASGRKVGAIDVFHLGPKLDDTSGAFSTDEQSLLSAIAEHLGRIAARRQADEKLRMFRELLDRTKDAVFVVDAEWARIIDVNQAACTSLGYSRDEFLAMKVTDIETKLPDQTHWTNHVDEVRSKGSMVLEGLHRAKDGRTFPVEVNVEYTGYHGRNYIIAVVRDITERKRAEEKLRRAAEEWTMTFNSISDPVSIHDKDFRLVRVNKAFADILGLKPDEVIGKTCYELVHGTKEPPADCPHKRTIDTRKPHIGEFFDKRLGLYLEVSTSPVLDENGELIGSTHIAKDITERKQSEQRQAELLKEIENANRELKDFAYIVSHDLKAPLRGIRTVVDWILEDYADKLDEEGSEQLNLLGNRVDRMSALIDGILEYSRIGRVHEEIEHVDLNKLVPEIIDALAPPENITITIENDLPTILGEPTRITQVFQNLLSNAVKYMDKPQGQISVACRDEGDCWKFSVADNGPGIDRQDYEKIFQIFQTLAPRDQVESTGVGLTVVKKIVEMYGGTIYVESQVGRGTTFFFTLPKNIKQAEAKDETREQANITC